MVQMSAVDVKYSNDNHALQLCTKHEVHQQVLRHATHIHAQLHHEQGRVTIKSQQLNTKQTLFTTAKHLLIVCAALCLASHKHKEIYCTLLSIKLLSFFFFFFFKLMVFNMFSSILVYSPHDMV